MNTETQSNQVEFKFSDLLKVFKRFWIFIIGATVIFGAVFATLGIVNTKKIYSANVSFWVGDVRDGSGFTQSSIMANSQQATNYMELATKDIVIRTAVKTHELNTKWGLTEDEAVKVLRKMIKTGKSSEESVIFSISVTSPTEDMTYEAINAIQYTMRDVVNDMNGGIETTGKTEHITLVDEVLSKSDLRKSVDNGLKKAVIVTLVVFVLTYMISFFIYMSDNNIRNTEMLTSRSDVILLGELPSQKALKKLSDEEKRLEMEKAYTMMRANINHSLGNYKHPVIAFSGSNETDIDTTLNLFRASARTGKEVLVIECIPGSNKFDTDFANDKEFGIFDYLNGKTDDFESLAFKSDDGLNLIKAGSCKEGISSALSSQEFKDMINQLKKSYDAVAILAEPISKRSDVALISKCTIGNIITLSTQNSKFNELKDTVSQLRNLDSDILGVVLKN